MLRLGIYTPDRYRRLRGRGPMWKLAISYKLADIPDYATDEEVRMFEDVHLSFCTSNGTFRKTFRHRFRDIDAALLKLLGEAYKPDAPLRVQDRAVSHALTSCEWAEQLLQVFPNADFEASDLLLNLYAIALSPRETYIVEPGGNPLQWVRPPFVVHLSQREPWRYLLNHLLAARAKRQFERLRIAERVADLDRAATDSAISKICCVHPEARSLARRNPQFRVVARSVFDCTPGLDVLRTMNILNRSYFAEQQLIGGIEAAFDSLKLGGIWIVGRTLEEDNTNHVTFFRKTERGWGVLLRIGKGWEMEDLASRASLQCALNQRDERDQVRA
jgi:hypothetical protein